MENEILKRLEILTASGKFAIGNDLLYLPDFSVSFNDLFKKKGVYNWRNCLLRCF